MNVAIINCGYIGTALAMFLAQRGDFVTATTHSPKKLKVLNKLVRKSIYFDGTDENELSLLLEDNDAIIFTPTSDSFTYPEEINLKTAQAIRRVATAKPIGKKLIFTSRTSVYGDQSGRWVDEDASLNPMNDAAKSIVETEESLISLQELGWSVCIFRVAYVYGPGREVSKKVLENLNHVLPDIGSHYTNMVHLQDVIRALYYSLAHDLEGIYNLADDDHPLRQELFDEISEKFHLPKITFNPVSTGLHDGNKRVSNHKIKAAGFNFQHPHRIVS